MLNRENRHADHRVTAIWGSGEERTQGLARTYEVGTIATAPESMLGQVDAVIVGDRHGDDHLPHALPFIEAGLPVFVDKPLARTVKDVETMLDAARKSGALVTSASALRWQQVTDELGAGVRRLGGPDRIVATASMPQSWRCNWLALRCPTSLSRKPSPMRCVSRCGQNRRKW
jgi:predicted dehydrogenase